MSDSDTPYTSVKRKGHGRPQKKKTRSSGPLEDEDDAPTPRSLRKRSTKNENWDNEFSDKPKSKRRKIYHIVFKSHIKSLCEFVLEGLMEHKFAFPFMHPVDTVKYPSYLDKVKEPMDFSTIKRKMEKDIYTEAEDFAMDVRLVFKNCLAFNDHESDLVFMAQSLRTLFEEAYVEIKKREKRLLEDVEFDEMKQLIEDLKNEHQRMLSELQRLIAAASPKMAASSTETNIAPATEAPKKEKKQKRPWDIKRKQDLSSNISLLNEDQMHKLISFIGALIPSLAQSGEAEVDLESQPDDKLTKIERFIRKTFKLGETNGHVDVDGVSSDESNDESEKKTVTESTQPPQVPIPESKSTEQEQQSKPTSLEESSTKPIPLEESSTREEKDKKDDKPPELELESHAPISSKTTIVQTTMEEKNEESSATSQPKTDDMMQIDNAQVEAPAEQKVVEPRTVEMTDALITTRS